MSRPDDWHVLGLDDDPTPGDPYQVQLLARRFLELSADAFAATTEVRRLVGGHGVADWVGDAGDAFADAATDLPGQLDKLEASYGIAGQALRTYGTELETAQLQADAALARGRELWLQPASTGTAPSLTGAGLTTGPTAGTWPDLESPTGLTAEHPAELPVELTDELATQRRLALAARQLREQAARTCRGEIERASDAGIQNRSFWGRLADAAGDLWDRAVGVAKVVAVVAGAAALVVGGPLAWVAVAAALVVLADTLDRYAHGDATLWDVGLAVLQCVPGTTGLTTVAGLGTGARLAAAGLRGLAAGRPVALATGATRLRSLAAAVRSGAAGGGRPGLDGVADVAFGARRTRIGADRETVAVAARGRPLDGYHDVVVHGNVDGFGPSVPTSALSPSQVADAIRANPSYVPGTPVRAVSCWTGAAGVDGPAQQLANHLQVEVLAPTVKAGVPAGLGTSEVVLAVGNRIVEPGTVVRLGNGEEVVAQWVRLTPGS